MTLHKDTKDFFNRVARISKGVVDQTVFDSGAGELPVDEARQFIDYVVDESKLMSNITVKAMKSTEEKFNRLFPLNDRVLEPLVPNSDSGIRRGVYTDSVSLTTKGFKLSWGLDDQFLEDNIEGSRAAEHIRRIMVAQASMDMERMLWYGDTLGAPLLESDYLSGGSSSKYIKDPVREQFNGFLKLADSGHVLDAGGETFGLEVLTDALHQLPTKYWRDKSRMRLFSPVYIANRWREKLSLRGTALGDKALSNGNLPIPHDLQMVECPLLDMNPVQVKHVTLTGTTAASLGYTDVTVVAVLPSTLASTATTPYIDTTDYVVSSAAGTIARSGGGSAISSGATVKVLFTTQPQLILTPSDNVVVGIWRKMTYETDRDIHAQRTDAVMTTRLGMILRNTDAVVKIKNLGDVK